MLTPLETQLLAALKLRRATNWPFVSVEKGGLGLTVEEHGTSADYHRRNMAADAAVDAAIEAGEEKGRVLSGGWARHRGGDKSPVSEDLLVEVWSKTPSPDRKVQRLQARTVRWSDVALYREGRPT